MIKLKKSKWDINRFWFLKTFLRSLSMLMIQGTVHSQNLISFHDGVHNAGSIYALEDDTVNHLLYAGGYFVAMNGLHANNIAVWNGITWDSLGGGISGAVYVIRKIGSDIYVGGSIQWAGNTKTNGIAKWDGSEWHALGEGLDNGVVLGIEEFNGEIFVAGDFIKAGNIAVGNIARWDGVTWQSVGAGSNFPIFEMTKADNKLFCSGTFSSFNGNDAKGFVSFNDTLWKIIDPPIEGTYLHSLTKFNHQLYCIDDSTIIHLDNNNWFTDYSFNEKGTLRWIGAFKNELYVHNDSLYLHNSRIRKLNSGILSGILATIPLLDYDQHVNAFIGTADGLFVGGSYTACNDSVTLGLVTYDGENWKPTGNAADEGTSKYNDVRTTIYDSLTQQIYVGGDFWFAGDKVSQNVGEWTGSEWKSMGSGLNDRVRKLVRYNGEIYAGGNFTTSGSTIVNHLAKWDGTKWIALGSGTDGIVYDLMVYNGNLYVGGDFSIINGLEADNIAYFNGTNWVTLGTNKLDEQVYSMDVYNDQIVATSAGGGSGFYLNSKWSKVAYLNLGTWTRMGEVKYDATDALVFHDSLYVACSESYGYELYRWNGISWDTLNYPINNIYGSLARLFIYRGELSIMGTSDGWWSYSDSQWKYLGRFFPFTINQVDSNHFIVGGFFSWIYLNTYEKKYLADLALLENSPPYDFSISSASDSLCPHDYAFFYSHGNELNPKIEWHFDGGFPDTSSHAAPIILYDEVGNFPVWVVVSNDFGSDTLFLTNNILVDSCNISLIDETEFSGIKIFPNPVNDYLNVSLNECLQISILDITGKLLMTEKISPSSLLHQIDIRALPAGVYILKAYRKEESYTMKFIRQ